MVYTHIDISYLCTDIRSLHILWYYDLFYFIVSYWGQQREDDADHVWDLPRSLLRTNKHKIQLINTYTDIEIHAEKELADVREALVHARPTERGWRRSCSRHSAFPASTSRRRRRRSQIGPSICLLSLFVFRRCLFLFYNMVHLSDFLKLLILWYNAH